MRLACQPTFPTKMPPTSAPTYRVENAKYEENEDQFDDAPIRPTVVEEKLQQEDEEVGKETFINPKITESRDDGFDSGLPELKGADSKEHKEAVFRRSKEPDHTKLEDISKQPQKMIVEPFIQVQYDPVAQVEFMPHQQNAAMYDFKFDTGSNAIVGSILLHSYDLRMATLHIKTWDPGIT